MKLQLRGRVCRNLCVYGSHVAEYRLQWQDGVAQAVEHVARHKDSRQWRTGYLTLLSALHRADEALFEDLVREARELAYREFGPGERPNVEDMGRGVRPMTALCASCGQPVPDGPSVADLPAGACFRFHTGGTVWQVVGPQLPYGRIPCNCMWSPPGSSHWSGDDHRMRPELRVLVVSDEELVALGCEPVRSTGEAQG